MQRLHGVVQNYAWGSRDLLAGLTGRAPSDTPEAEIWYGAHHNAPSVLNDGSTLLAVLEHDAAAQLGVEIATEFDGKLPFLLKLLAAAEPLSIQAHPTRAQARAGFDNENAAGMEQGTLERSFHDDWPKPELLAALTPFEAMLGFRPERETIELLGAVGASNLEAVLVEHGLAATVTWALASPDADRASVAAATEQLAQAVGEQVEGRWSGEADMLLRIAQLYPGDPGLLIASLLNRVLLAPGEAVYLDAGTLHAYVGGLGVEIMANSDNVVRGGLTQKHVDTTTLLDIVRDEPMGVEVLTPDSDGTYPSPAKEFALTSVGAETRLVEGPAIVLCVGGTALVQDERAELALLPTDAAWISAAERVNVVAQGQTFIARLPMR